jgi:hypothetical protein
MALIGYLRRRVRARPSEALDAALLAALPLSTSASGGGNGSGLAAPVSPHLVALLGHAIREPLKHLRRLRECPREALAQLEHLAWQTRMIVAHPRPMQSKLVAPLAILQEAAQQVPALRDGRVGASWSLMNRQPVQVDPERAEAAFREILMASAAICGERGRLAIRILPGDDASYPVRVEVEIGRPGAEADPLAFLVARHLLESQGGRVETDGRLTCVLLRSSAPDAALAAELSA